MNRSKQNVFEQLRHRGRYLAYSMEVQDSKQKNQSPHPKTSKPVLSGIEPAPFSLQDAALLANISIEASAGTGKTYTLEQIVCHLLEQYGLNIKQILLLTYTEKAASELRERIRSKLSQRFSELKNLQTNVQDDAKDSVSELHEVAKNRILKALNQFNEASISTIHSFFQRCLELYPLEVGRPLKTLDTGAKTAIDSNGDPVRELVLDELQSYDEELKNSLLRVGDLAILDGSGQLDSQKVLDYCANTGLQNFWNMHPHFSLYPGKDELKTFEALEQDFSRGRGQVFTALVQLCQCDWHEGIFANRSSSKKLKNLPAVYTSKIAVDFFAELKSLLELQPQERFQALLELLQVYPIKVESGKAKHLKDPYLVLLQCLHPEKLEVVNSEKFATPIDEWAHYSKALAVRDFLEAFPSYLDLVHETTLIQATYLAQFLFAMRSKVYPKLQAVKSLQGTRSFNDMVEDLYKVIVLKQHGDPEALLSLVRRQYRTVLIDEFQDTDPIQWQIIFEVFGQGKLKQKGEQEHRGKEESKEESKGRGISGLAIGDALQEMLVRSHNFIIVGDPKQSIYGFRGASRQLYQQVQGICDFHYRLGANYRSNASLVGACNQIFQKVWQDSGVFKAVSSANVAQPPLLLESGLAESAAFTFLDCDSMLEDSLEGSGKVLHKASHSDLRKVGIEAIAQKIEVLLSGSELVRQGKKKRLRADDIAVLVREKKDGQSLQVRLAELGIAGQFREERSVFSDPSAQALLYFLLALCQPRDLDHSVRLLLSHFFGLQVAEVHFLFWGEGVSALEYSEFALLWIEKLISWKLQVDMGQLQGVLEELFQYGNGFQVVLQGFGQVGQERSMLQQDLFCRILSGGVNRKGQSALVSYNNLRHLMEVLNSEQLASGLDCRALCKFLGQQVEAGREGACDGVYKQRSLEIEAVQIMTIHKSKGLEFPVVFLSFGLDIMKDSGLYVQGGFSQEEGAQGVYRQTAYLGLKSGGAFWRESCAELRRLLYVGLTRASAKVYFPFHSACPVKKRVPYRSILEEMLGLARLGLFLNGEDALFLNLTEGFEHVSYADGGEVRAVLEKWAVEFPLLFSVESARRGVGLSVGSGAGVREEVSEGYRELQVDNLRYRFPAVSSFSSLQRSIGGAERREGDVVFDGVDKERDAEGAVLWAPDLGQGQEWHALWLSPGAGLGNLLHNLLETCDYQWIAGLSLVELVESEVWYEQVSLQSRGYFPRDWVKRAYPALCHMVWHTLHKDLAFSAGLSGRLCLCELAVEQRRHEVEFLLRIPRDCTLQLEQFLLSVPGRVEVSEGFLKGFIDLLFVHGGQVFLLDWKSNIQHGMYGMLADAHDLEQIRGQLYAAGALKGLMEQHFYTMQYLIYLSVLYYYLRVQYGSAFLYEEHFGGCYYLFLRGSSADEESDTGVFFHKPEEAMVLAILQQLGLLVPPS